MLSGVLYGLGACVLWGFVYLVPLVLPDYDPVIIATARYISFGGSFDVDAAARICALHP